MRAGRWTLGCVALITTATAYGDNGAFDPGDVVFKNRHPVKCEQAARAVEAQDALNGWRVLWRCVEEGVWPDLEVLNTQPWADHITTRKDGPLLIARLLALRGGHLEADLEKLRPVNKQLVTLADALARPKAAAGKVVLFRGTREDFLELDDGEYLQFAETSLATEVKAKSAYDAQRMQQGNGRGYTTYDGRYYGSYNSYGSVRRGDTTQNHKGRTGRYALVRMPKKLPNVQPGKEYLCAVAYKRVDTLSVNPDNPMAEDPVVVGNFLVCHSMATKVME